VETKIFEIAQRIKGLREILEITPEQMARYTDTTIEEYLECETGKVDFGFTFLYECAKVFGVDIIEILTGEKPKLSKYSVVRAGKGLPIRRREGFTYEHMAYRMKNKLAEPFVVTAPYHAEEQSKPIHLFCHAGQEFNYILKGSLKVQLGEHLEVLGEGDSIFYDSGDAHGMIATGGSECVFLAIVMKDPHEAEEEI